MATSGAQLRAMVMAANDTANKAVTMARQAESLAREAEESYRRISEKLGSSATMMRIAQEGGLEVAIVNINSAISDAERYAATVA